MNSILEIIAEACRISVTKGFLLIARGTAEDKVPLSEIEALIISSRGAVITNQAIHRLSEEGVPIVHNGPNAQPCALTLPYGANIFRKERITWQISASQPLRKNLWRQVVKAKISNQAAVLGLAGKRRNDLDALAAGVLSGDSGNAEAVAARSYWQRLFGKSFRRNPDLPGINAHLNYGYAILRASLCRALVASGLLPELGIHHRNLMDPFCLADDLMEPYRPFADLLVHTLRISTKAALTSERKIILAGLLNLPLSHENTDTRLRFCLLRTVEQLVRSFEAKKPLLNYPTVTADHMNWFWVPLPGKQVDGTGP